MSVSPIFNESHCMTMLVFAVLMIKRFPQPLIKVMEGGQAMFSCEASTRQGVLVFKWFQTTASGSVHQVPCKLSQYHKASDMLFGTSTQHTSIIECTSSNIEINFDKNEILGNTMIVHKRKTMQLLYTPL